MRHLISSTNLTEHNRVLNRIWDAIDGGAANSGKSGIAAPASSTVYSNAGTPASTIPAWVNRISAPFGVIQIVAGEINLDANGCTTVVVVQ